MTGPVHSSALCRASASVGRSRVESFPHFTNNPTDIIILKAHRNVRREVVLGELHQQIHRPLNVIARVHHLDRRRIQQSICLLQKSNIETKLLSVGLQRYVLANGVDLGEVILHPSERAGEIGDPRFGSALIDTGLNCERRRNGQHSAEATADQLEPILAFDAVLSSRDEDPEDDQARDCSPQGAKSYRTKPCHGRNHRWGDDLSQDNWRVAK